MGAYLFQGEDVYVAVDGGVERMPFDECAALFTARDGQAHVLMAAPDGTRLMEHVRRVRKIFPPRGIRTLVPYAAALRMSLQARGLVPAGESAIVADDLGDKFLITVMHPQQAAFTRAIPLRDPARIVEELRRTQKSVIEDGVVRKEPVFRILSNNKDVIASLDAERRKEAVSFEGVFPVFEVLGRVKFPFMLMTPEEAAAQKRMALRRGMILACLVAAGLAGSGAAFFIYARGMDKAMDRKMSVLEREEDGLEQQVRALSVATYQARLQALPQVAFARILERFFLCIPAEGRVEGISWERQADKSWAFSAVLVVAYHKILPFLGEDLFKKVEVQQMFIQDKPAIRVSLLLPGERGHE